MDKQVQIFPSIKARLLCEYEKDDWPIIDQAIQDLPDDSLIIAVGSNGFISKMGEVKPEFYPAKVYVVTSIDCAYTVQALKRIGSLQFRSETLADKIIALKETESIPEEILTELKGLIEDCVNAAVEPISKFKILMNFISICGKRGMSFLNPFNTYTMNINNCYLLSGTEAGEQ